MPNKIEVRGFASQTELTDTKKSEFKSHWELSLTRAHNVANYLMKNLPGEKKPKIIPERIVIVARGKHDRLATDLTEEGRAKNRRVEIIVTDERLYKEREH